MPCPVCGNPDLATFEICPVCAWEVDIAHDECPCGRHDWSSANGACLTRYMLLHIARDVRARYHAQLRVMRALRSGRDLF